MDSGASDQHAISARPPAAAASRAPNCFDSGDNAEPWIQPIAKALTYRSLTMASERPMTDGFGSHLIPANSTCPWDERSERGSAASPTKRMKAI